MALDKVIDSAELDANLTAVADAIRAKGGTAESMEFPDGFVSAVEGIQAGGGSDNSLLVSVLNRSITSLSDESITSLGYYALAKCTKLESVNLPNLTGAKNNILSDCTSLKTIKMPKLKTAMEGANLFANCTALVELDLSGLRYAGGSMVSGCTSLEELNLPSFDGNVFSSEFKNCTNLRLVDFGGRVNIVREEAFYNCTNLEAVIMRGNSIGTLNNVHNFKNSGVAAGTGYLYVPRALLSDDDETKDYRRATNWSTYASQFRAIEDYPEICGEASA